MITTNVFFTVHECLFCPQTFDSAETKDDHILEHFAQEICVDCNQNLIRVGRQLYTPHNQSSCIKTELKIEPILFERQSELFNEDGDEIRIETGSTTATSCVTDMQIKSEPLLNLERLNTNEHFPHDEDVISIEQLNLFGRKYEEPNSASERIQHEQFANENIASIESQRMKPELMIEERNIFDGLDDKLEQANSKNIRINRKRKLMDEYSECELCGKIMLTPSLYYHMRNIHNTPSNDEEFKCEPCRKKFKTADILRKHMRMKHDPTVKKLKCDLCRLVFMKETSLRDHQCKRKSSEVVKSDKMPCDECGKLLSNRNSLRKHKTLLHSAPGAIFCNVCGRLFSSCDDRDEHQTECSRRHRIRNAEFFRASQARRKSEKMKHDEKSIHDDTQLNQQNASQLISNVDNPAEKQVTSEHSECHICGKCLLTASLYNHMKNVHRTPGPQSKQFKCDICKIEFKTEENHRKHMRMKHDPNVKKFKCDVCCRVFVQTSSLKTHNCGRETGKCVRRIPMPCEICGKILSSKGTLQKHQILLHSLPDTIFCNVCGRKFNSTDDRDAHREECARKTQIRKSKAFGELGCFICSTMFKSNKLLRNHIDMKHTNCETFSCNLCKMIFMKEFSLRAHICKPKRDNCVSCEVCGKDLATRRSLRVHKILVHSPADLIFCNLCGKKSATVEERDSHRIECALKKKMLNAKRKSTRLECDVCKAVFKDKSRIQHHMLQAHNIVKEQRDMRRKIYSPDEKK